MSGPPFELRNQAFLTGPEIANGLTAEGNTPRQMKDQTEKKRSGEEHLALLAKPVEYPSWHLRII